MATNQIDANNLHVHCSEVVPLLTVIVPVYNESRFVGECIARVCEMRLVDEVIVVDDGSTDESFDVVCKSSGEMRLQVLRHSGNRGKGAAIRTALQRARGRFTIIQDADLEYDPRDYEKLLDPLLAGVADVIYGSRYLNAENNFAGRRQFDLGVMTLNLAVRWIYGVKTTDEATCYKLFPTSLLRAMDLECERFEFCPEVTAKACRLGLRIKEVPICYSPRSITEGKKIRLRDGLQALWTLWKYRNWEGQWDRDVNEDVSNANSQQAMDAVRTK